MAHQVDQKYGLIASATKRRRSVEMIRIVQAARRRSARVQHTDQGARQSAPIARVPRRHALGGGCYPQRRGKLYAATVRT